MAVDQTMTGPALQTDGQPTNMHSNNYSDLLVAETSGKYLEWCRRGYVFTAITTSGVGVAIAGVGSSTAYPILWNRTSQGKMIVPLILQVTPVYYGAGATVANVNTGGFCIASVTGAGDVINSSYLSTMTNSAPVSMVTGRSYTPTAQFSGTAGVGSAGVLARILDVGGGLYVFNATTAMTQGAMTLYPPYDFQGFPILMPGGAWALCQNATMGTTLTYNVSWTFAELPLVSGM